MIDRGAGPEEILEVLELEHEEREHDAEAETPGRRAGGDQQDRDGGEEEQVAEGQLYVVEERYIRMRPARILSDGTVEAETEEGWMRFENLEHLDEYLDAAEPAKG